MRQLLIILALVPSLSFSQMMPEKVNSFYEELMTLPFDKKLKKIDKAIQKNPKDPWFYWMKADVYNMMGDSPKTIENYNKSLAVDSSFSAGHGSLARHLYMNNADPELSLHHINKAITLEPQESYYHIDRGNIYFLTRRYEPALEEARYVISLEDGHLQEAIKLFIKTLHAQDKKDELMNILKAIDLTQFGGFMDTEFDILLGDLYLECGDKEKSCKCYEVAADIYTITEAALPQELAGKMAQCRQ